MRREYLCAVLLMSAPLLNCGAGTAARSLSTSSAETGTTTTLSAQIGNNTSASNGFANQSNGNLGASNISKLNVHSLLYPGATTKVLAHLLLWFGESGHMNVGYSSSDPAQVQRQIEDMISRGIDGVVVDWYGPNNAEDQAAQAVMHEAEKHPGFSFAVMVDAGAIKRNPCSQCSPQQALTKLLQYVEQHYFPSSAYVKIGGQPLVTEFNIDYDYSIDWDEVNASLTTPPRYLFQDGGGFSHPLSDGSYSWVMPQMSNDGLEYLSSFYATGLGYGNLETVGASYKGFNDSLAAWGTGRTMSQQCGETWLQTFSQVNQIYSQSRQLPYLQLVTWNDYEEGTEIETGIDPCFGLTTSVAGNTLQWQIGGSEMVIDHYNVYSSTDGQNLANVAQVETGVHSVDLCSLKIPQGKQQFFVQAVGKPMMANRMPPAVDFTPSCQ